ncbi:hypothetical protein [Lysobacter gummosus]|uniref:hypothetical protein n=1 Tax=Lysobacter gummosus TaxID=262324 RepID=UPI0036458113
MPRPNPASRAATRIAPGQPPAPGPALPWRAAHGPPVRRSARPRFAPQALDFIGSGRASSRPRFHSRRDQAPAPDPP